MNKLSIIIVTYNRLGFLEQTIQSLERSLENAPFMYDAVVIDNHSTQEGYPEYLDFLETKGYKVFTTQQNIGWGAAVNIGRDFISESSWYVLLLNDDVILDTNWYDKAMALFEEHKMIGILGLWRHTSHGIKEDRGNLLIMDDAPAVAWIIPHLAFNTFPRIPEHGPCSTKGGNGEDSAYVKIVQEHRFLVACPKVDLANHITGY